MAHIDRQPSDEIFEDMRQAALSTWSKYDDTYGYQTEKNTEVNRIQNYADNWCAFLGMMDSTNQSEFMDYLRYQETRDFLNAQRVHYSYPEA